MADVRELERQAREAEYPARLRQRIKDAGDLLMTSNFSPPERNPLVIYDEEASWSDKDFDNAARFIMDTSLGGD